MTGSSAPALCVLVLLWLFTGDSLAQSNGNYLESLKDEAASLNLDRSAQSVEKPPVSGLSTLTEQRNADAEHAGAIREFESGLTVQQFETLLKHNYIGSYLFYKRLNDAEKAEVYRYYQQNPNPKQVREKILELSKN